MEYEVKKKNLFAYILFTALLTGIIDILLAFIINYKVPVAVILKFIASGWFGHAAFKGGMAMVCYGLLFHFCFAAIWTTVFFLLYPKLLWRIKPGIVLIIITGCVMWVVMGLVIVPLSHTPHDKFHLLPIIINMSALIVAYGLPFTLFAAKFYHKRLSN